MGKALRVFPLFRALTAAAERSYPQSFALHDRCGIGPHREENEFMSWVRWQHIVVGSKRRSSIMALVALSGFLHGCAIDNVGTLAAQVTHAESAVVVDLYTIGAHLRTSAEDRGLTLGFGRRSSVFAPESAATVPAGWHLFWVPLPPVAPIVRHGTSLGLDVRAGPVAYGITVGLRVATELGPIPHDAQIVLALDYTPAQPGLTRLYLCGTSEPCSTDAVFSD